MSEETDSGAMSSSTPFEPTHPVEFRPLDDDLTPGSTAPSKLSFAPDSDDSWIDAPTSPKPTIFSADAPVTAQHRARSAAPVERGAVARTSTWVIATVALVVVLAASLLGAAVWKSSTTDGTNVHVEVRSATTVRLPSDK